jgi:carbon-monoxide dehydrogenase medium subunit
MENAVFDHIQAFYQPTSVREAVRLLASSKGRGRVVAGGTDLALLRDRSIRFLVDITHLGLNNILRDAGGITIGAGCTMSALEHSPLVRGLANGILARAAATCGSIQIRNLATIGGNLAHGSPAADTATPLLAMDAMVALQTERGRRQMTMRDFFALPPKRRVNGGLLVEICVPKVKGRAGWSFQKFGRTETDIAVVNAAAGLGIAKDGTCAWARIALGAVAPTPMRAEKAEAMLTGKNITSDLIDSAAHSVASEVQPITDQRASGEYRREISQVLARRALRECAKEAGCTL